MYKGPRLTNSRPVDNPDPSEKLSMNLPLPTGNIDLLAIGETLIDFISEETVPSLREAETFRRFQGGSPGNIAGNVARLGGKGGLVSKIGDDALADTARPSSIRWASSPTTW